MFNSYPKEVLLSIAPKGKIKISDTVPGRFKPDENFLVPELAHLTRLQIWKNSFILKAGLKRLNLINSKSLSSKSLIP